ncbi:hypothetical protein [Streptomyces sp. NPDC059649]|uniref:hypothetical protein n=1 Tax=Streptomyces sp. NPDC059649 TaxID=3346895 RepID=UPI0036AFB5FB
MGEFIHATSALRPRAGGVHQGGPQLGKVPLPPADLRAALAPVDMLWARLDHPYTRRLVEAAVRSELATVAGFAGRDDAPQVLSGRLARRLLAQGSPRTVTDPVGWMIRRGLPQRRSCGDVRCDEGLLLDSGRECATCEDIMSARRTQRCKVVRAVAAAMPLASDTERRTEAEQRLHKAVTAEARAKADYWQQVKALRHAHRSTLRAEDAEPVIPVVLPAMRPAAVLKPDAENRPAVDEAPLILEDLTPDEIITWRARAERHHQVVFDHIDVYGESSARRLFTNQSVDRVQRLASARHLTLGSAIWGQ